MKKKALTIEEVFKKMAALHNRKQATAVRLLKERVTHEHLFRDALRAEVAPLLEPRHTSDWDFREGYGGDDLNGRYWVLQFQDCLIYALISPDHSKFTWQAEWGFEARQIRINTHLSNIQVPQVSIRNEKLTLVLETMSILHPSDKIRKAAKDAISRLSKRSVTAKVQV